MTEDRKNSQDRAMPIATLADLLLSLPRLGDDAQPMLEDITAIKRYTELPESPWNNN
jgi:hypothetical protein